MLLAGAVAIGSVGLAKAKADHDETLGERKQLHELSPEEQKQLKNVAPVREEYEEAGLVVLVGKDVEPAVGMRVRMREGLISHGAGTITALFGPDAGEEAGCCEVVWDSNQSHTRGLHVKMGNKHICRAGKEDHFDLMLAENTMCSELTIVSHKLILNGREREHLEVVAQCRDPQPVAGLTPLLASSSAKTSNDAFDEPQVDNDDGSGAQNR